MEFKRALFVPFVIAFCSTSFSYGATEVSSDKKKILVVSSYHREYVWSQETNAGFCAAMLKLGYFDSQAQADEYTRNDYAATSKVIVKKLWMDAKRKSSKREMAQSAAGIMKIAEDFKPELIFLGDDDAAQYIGGQFLDSRIPIVFWGVNSTPVKYGLVDSEDRPGHNITGVYQIGYYIEGLQLLKTLKPSAKTFAILSDDSSAGRSRYKEIEYLDRQGLLPLKLTGIASTNNFELWKSKALELQKKVDAFYVAQYAALKDKNGDPVSTKEAAKWYITNISLPEAVSGQFVREGMLCAAYDAGYNQGFEAVMIAHDILAKGANPATYRPRAPKRGPLMANRQRAEMLKITLTKEMGIEEYIDKASALK